MPRTRSSTKPHSDRESFAAEAAGDLWGEAQARVWQPPIDRRALRERVLELAPAFRRRLVKDRRLEVEWAPLGVEVRAVKMRARGLCSTRDGQRVVFVNQADRYELQRFTVAHEVAHMLMADQGPRRRPLAPREEEVLCEEFASRMLIDRAILTQELGLLSAPPDPERLLRLCGRFRVNVRPMQIAVGELLADTPYALLLSRRRGHWRRPAELAFRVEALAGARHSFLPRHQRLSSLGLSELHDAAERSSHGTRIDGWDRSVKVELRGLPQENSSASAHGAVRWRAIFQGHTSPFLLAVLDLSGIADFPWAGSP